MLAWTLPQRLQQAMQQVRRRWRTSPTRASGPLGVQLAKPRRRRRTMHSGPRHAWLLAERRVRRQRLDSPEMLWPPLALPLPTLRKRRLTLARAQPR